MSGFWLMAGVLMLSGGFLLADVLNKKFFAVLGFGGFLYSLLKMATFDPTVNLSPETITNVGAGIFGITGFGLVIMIVRQHFNKPTQNKDQHIEG